MHIAIVSPEFPPDIGGIETYSYEFTRELATRGHQITVFTCRHAAGEVELPGVTVHPLLRLRRSLDSPALAPFSAEVWHVMNAAYSWLALEGRKTVISVHGNDFLRPYLPVATPDFGRLPLVWRWTRSTPGWLKTWGFWRTTRLVRQALPHAHHLITNSRYTERALLEQYPQCRGKTSVGFVGVGAHFFDVPRQPATDGIPRFITVCRLSEPRKNVDRVLQALAPLKESHAFRYTVIGDGSDRPRLERLASELGLADRVDFTGFIARNELLGHYSRADLFVLASSIIPGSFEGFGIVYLEAAASGVPSVAARQAGAAEAVGEGKSGFFVEQPEVEQLRAALQRFLKGEATFKFEACRAFAREFSWAKVVDHALFWYQNPC